MAPIVETSSAAAHEQEGGRRPLEDEIDHFYRLQQPADDLAPLHGEWPSRGYFLQLAASAKSPVFSWLKPVQLAVKARRPALSVSQMYGRSLTRISCSCR